MEKKFSAAFLFGALVLTMPVNGYLTHSQKHALKGVCYASIIPLIVAVAGPPFGEWSKSAFKHNYNRTYDLFFASGAAVTGVGLLWAGLSSYNSFRSAVEDTDVVKKHHKKSVCH